MAGAENGLVAQEAGAPSPPGNAGDSGGLARGSSDDRGGVGHDRGSAGVVAQLTRETSAAVAIIEATRDLLGDDADMIATTVEGETNLHEAIAAAVRRLAELEALSDGIDLLAGALSVRKERFSKQRQSIREAIAVAMEAAELRKLELPLATVSLTATAPKVIVSDESAIPTNWMKAQPPKLDKEAITKALKDGATIPGATLSNGGQTIALRFK